MSLQNVIDSTQKHVAKVNQALEDLDFNTAEQQIDEVMRCIGIARQVQMREKVVSQKFNDTQELLFALIARCDSNDFHGERIVAKLRENASLWDAVLPDLTVQYTLCRLTEGGNFIDTLYIRCRTEHAQAMKVLGKHLGADESDIITTPREGYGDYIPRYLLDEQKREGYSLVRWWYD